MILGDSTSGSIFYICGRITSIIDLEKHRSISVKLTLIVDWTKIEVVDDINNQISDLIIE
jgi:hypothetical protein